MKKYLGWICSGIILIVLGIIMLMRPASVLRVIVIMIGIYAIFEGVFSFISSFSVRTVGPVFKVSLIKALVNLFIGILVIYFAASASAQTVADWVVYLIAIDLLLNAIAEGIEIYILSRAGFSMYGLTSGAVLSLVLSLIMFLFPQAVNATIFTFLAILVILAGVSTIMYSVRLIKARGSDKIAEAEFEER